MPLFDKLTDKFNGLTKERWGGNQDKDHDGSHNSLDGYESSHGQRQGYSEQQQPYGAIPPLPLGWVQKWVSTSGRYYYVEQVTGHTQWEIPMMYPNGYMQFLPLSNKHGSYAGERYPASHCGSHECKINSRTGTVLAGGALLGAAGGAWAMHKYDEHEGEESAATSASVVAPQTVDPAPAGDTIYVPAEAADSDVEEAAEEVSDEREDVAEAQEELVEASSESDREEAREELEKQKNELDEAHAELEEEIEEED